MTSSDCADKGTFNFIRNELLFILLQRDNTGEERSLAGVREFCARPFIGKLVKAHSKAPEEPKWSKMMQHPKQ